MVQVTSIYSLFSFIHCKHLTPFDYFIILSLLPSSPYTHTHTHFFPRIISGYVTCIIYTTFKVMIKDLSV